MKRKTNPRNDPCRRIVPVAGRQRVGGKHSQPQSHRFHATIDRTAWYAEAVSAAVDNGLLVRQVQHHH